jgi:hypothetical protein
MYGDEKSPAESLKYMTFGSLPMSSVEIGASEGKLKLWAESKRNLYYCALDFSMDVLHIQQR